MIDKYATSANGEGKRFVCQPLVFHLLQFLQKLLRAQPSTISDVITKQDREVSPSDIADRLIIVRHGMAKGLMAGLPKYVANSNLEVYRKHVESGIVKDKPKYRRR